MVEYAADDDDTAPNAETWQDFCEWRKERRRQKANGQHPPSGGRAAPKERPWPKIEPVAYLGLAGDIVEAISPHSEADSVALLIQTLVSAGSIIGRNCYYQIEGDRHHANLSAVLVGQSAKARKGTSWGRVCSVAKHADLGWVESRIKGGLSSGEGLIDQVRDPIVKWDAKNKTWDESDPGVADKRLMLIEPEFAGALAVMDRPGNTVSQIVRKAWDGATLETLTRSSPLKASNTHISIIGHITEDELRARLTQTDRANGFANRFLFPMVKRSKLLPHGGNLSDGQIRELGESLRDAIAAMPKVPTRVEMDDDARAMWAQIYKELSADKPGLLGAVTARGEAQTIRLAMVYAMLGGGMVIEPEHLEAGLAVWKYCEASAERIFGDATGDPLTDSLVAALKNAGAEGLTRTQIRDLFSRHESGARIDSVLADLLTSGRAHCEMRATAGRPTEYWFLKGGEDEPS